MNEGEANRPKEGEREVAIKTSMVLSPSAKRRIRMLKEYLNFTSDRDVMELALVELVRKYQLEPEQET